MSNHNLFPDRIPDISEQTRQEMLRNVEVGRDFTAGDINQENHHYYTPPMRKAGVSPQKLPLGTGKFVGRTHELQQIHEVFQQRNGVVISAIAGMGGVGKTELAIQYATAYQQDYFGGICWMNVLAGELETQLVSFVRNYIMVVPSELNGRSLSVAEQVQYCLGNWTVKGNVLLILDDVSLETPFQTFVQQLPPRFRVLLTTQRKGLDPGFFELALYTLTEAEGLKLLQGLLGAERIANEQESAVQLCKWVGYLPLGLELVGRYLANKPFMSLAEMLNKLTLEHEATERDKRQVMTAQRGVAAAFEVSWQGLTETTQQVGRVLGLFEPDAFPWSLVADISQQVELADDVIEVARDQLYQQHWMQEATAGSFRLHPLIQAFLRAKLNATGQTETLQRAFIGALVKVAQDIIDDDNLTRDRVQQIEPLLPHLKIVAESMLERIPDEDLYKVFAGLGDFYFGQGLYALAEPWYESGLTVVKNRLGEEHQDVATCLNNLAILRRFQGHLKKAEPLYLKALKLRTQLLGIDRLETAQCMNDLAGFYREQGRYSESEILYLQSLEARKKQLGQEHSEVAVSFHNLAGLYQAQGRYKEAESLYLQSLEIERQIFGQEHSSVATSLHNLAGLYQAQGRYKEAESLYLQSLEIERQIFGQEHSSVATSLHNLAGLYEAQGRYKEAESLYLQSLEIKRQIFGQEHSSVATSLHNLAGLYEAQGRYKEAESLYLQSLEIKRQIFGQEHSSVATSLHNLAGLYEAQGRYKEAESLYLQSLEIKRQIFGQEHSSVATSLHNLAGLYEAQGRYKEAESLYLQSLEIKRQIFGQEHSSVATSLHNLAGLYQAQGRYKEAESLYLQSLEIERQIFGQEHSSVAATLNNLAGLYPYSFNPWKWWKANKLRFQATRITWQKLGWKHPNTRTAVFNLIISLLLSSLWLWILIMGVQVWLRSHSIIPLVRSIFFLFLSILLSRWNVEERLWAKARHKLSRWKFPGRGTSR